mmetsp:Transcript_22498/g.47396  ORF Transcript_22498/g.47396 Transcript_22498/m.47396 type:complete len:560 (+) Transcript_22498:243-1922(+)
MNGSIDDSITAGNEDGICIGEERDAAEGSMLAKEEGGASSTSQSPTSSSGYSSNPHDDARNKGRLKLLKRSGENRELKPAPYFYYIDHSQDIDDDPLAPLFKPLSMPNFLMKLHAILICESMSGVIEWMPHGRSWKILNQSEFEKQVLPTYFEQGSIASFYRQANGWGFRRVLRGPDKGSFYNERFLRGLPFLCKKIKRIGGAKMIEDTNIHLQPDLWKISADHPLPQELPKDCLQYKVLHILNKCIQERGPKAKMPFGRKIGSTAAKKRKASGNQKSKHMRASISNTSSDTSSASPNQDHSIDERLNHSQIDSLFQVCRQRLPDHGELCTHQNHSIIEQQVQIQQNQNYQISSLLSQILVGNNLGPAFPPRQQQQPGLEMPGANLTNMSSSSGSFLPTPAPAASVDSTTNAAPSLQGDLANNLTNLSSAMGLQVGTNQVLPQTTLEEQIASILGQINHSQGNQAQAASTTLNSGTQMSGLLQNLSHNQYQPAPNSSLPQLLHPHLANQTQNTMSQNPFSTIDSSLLNQGRQHVQSLEHLLQLLQILQQCLHQSQPQPP